LRGQPGTIDAGDAARDAVNANRKRIRLLPYNQIPMILHPATMAVFAGIVSSNPYDVDRSVAQASYMS